MNRGSDSAAHPSVRHAEAYLSDNTRNGGPASIGGYPGKSAVLDEALTEFAVAYPDQTELDHVVLGQAVDDGRAVAETGSSPGQGGRER